MGPEFSIAAFVNFPVNSAQRMILLCDTKCFAIGCCSNSRSIEVIRIVAQSFCGHSLAWKGRKRGQVLGYSITMRIDNDLEALPNFECSRRGAWCQRSTRVCDVLV